MSATHESIVLIGGEGAVAQTLSAMLGGWSIGFFQADFSDSDTTMAAVNAASLILVAVDDDAPGPALACCGILKEHDSGVSAPVAIVTPERADATLRLAALRAGADDVIGLEHNLATAAARISALLRFRTLQSEAGALAEGWSTPRAAAVPDETVRVLIVAEEPAMRQDLLKSMLSLTTTVATGNLREALYLASSQRFDLVLVHGGPVLADGLRICGQLRCVPGMRFVPLFALSEPGGIADISGDAARSADDCMAWPGENGELILRALLHLRRKRFVEALGAAIDDIAEAPETIESDTGLLAPERFATTLNALKREASTAGAPLYMGVVRVPEDASGARAEAVAALIRYHLSGRDAASRVENGLFAILYPDRRRDDAEQAIAALRQRLDANLARLLGEGVQDAYQPATDPALAIRTALTEVN